ncbi:uncharacterized protein Bfra_000364 [Botrytis fragariae]|uniref:DUF2406 domain-containing protein n=1 Tax=Botrytis fragariae TaxID=1964551 RepID=A0A8H6B2J6_9HELO|nr:uncharacterized protein Bfra_000364 [Botrytis fragariae]KAF5878199.1 hypothetical protein Bfra_000364 [Botrytis fragariae]
MQNQNHPLPSPPGNQERPGNRQRAKTSSGFSLHSHKSSGSGSGQKLDLTETHREKEAKRLHSKADPSLAMTEAEPSAVANDVATSLAPIRAIQHRDSQGNPIADPDRSNPTRSRWERPLDTIRAFEAAIDGNYSSRKSMIRGSESDVGSTYNRRNSYYAASQMHNDERPRYSQQSYYGGGQQPYRQSSHYGGDGRPNAMTRPDSYYTTDNHGGHGNGYAPNRSRYPRTASEPQFNSGVYTAPGGQQHSYETVTTASGSGMSGDAAGYSTDPSSLNSSVDGLHALPQQPKEPAETYGLNGFGNNPQYLPPGSGINEQNGARRQPIGQGPPPSNNDSTPRTPINLGITSENSLPQKSVVQITKSEAKPQPEKRKSWFGRRLSKNK